MHAGYRIRLLDLAWRQGDTGWMIDRAKELVAQWSAALSQPEDAA